MSPPTHSDIFTDVVNDLIGELRTLPRGTNTILSLLVNNLDSPVLAEIHSLSLSNLNTNQMGTLVPVLAKTTGLLSLALPQCKPSPQHIKFLLECPALSKLQSLDLRDVNEVKSNDLLALSQSTTLINLTSLNLNGCKVTTSRVDSSPQNLGGLPGGFPTFGHFGGFAPVPPPQQGQQAAEDLSGLTALLSSPVLKNLTHLDLGSTDITKPETYVALATSPHLSNLVSLDLSHNKINSTVVTALATSTTLANLTHVNLANNSLGDSSILQLFSPPSLLATKLKSLNLSGNNNMSDFSLQIILKGLPQLAELLLEGNYQVGATGTAFIAAHMYNLTKLNLSNCRVSNQGYAALATSTALSNLRELDLSANETDVDYIVALVNSSALANLTSLNLAATHNGSKVLTAIAKSAAMSKLECLMFYGNEAGDDGVTALAQSTTLTNLTQVDLNYNCVGPSGITALCSSPVASKLSFLALNGNNTMGNSLVSALAAPTSTLRNIRELILHNVGLNDQGVLQLLATPNLNGLNVLDISSNQTTKAIRELLQCRF